MPGTPVWTESLWCNQRGSFNGETETDTACTGTPSTTLGSVRVIFIPLFPAKAVPNPLWLTGSSGLHGSLLFWAQGAIGSNPEGSRELCRLAGPNGRRSQSLVSTPSIGTQQAGNRQLQGWLSPCQPSPCQHPQGIKLQRKEFIAGWLWKQKICYSEERGQGEVASGHVRSQKHALDGEKKSPNTQIRYFRQICVSLST